MTYVYKLWVVLVHVSERLISFRQSDIFLYCAIVEIPFLLQNVCENLGIQKYCTSESILFSILISLKMLKNNVWSYRAMPKHNTLNSSPLSNVEAVKKRKYIIIFHSTLVLLSQITLVILFCKMKINFGVFALSIIEIFPFIQ